jgi:hypothetical protein
VRSRVILLPAITTTTAPSEKKFATSSGHSCCMCRLSVVLTMSLVGRVSGVLDEESPSSSLPQRSQSKRKQPSSWAGSRLPGQSPRRATDRACG